MAVPTPGGEEVHKPGLLRPEDVLERAVSECRDLGRQVRVQPPLEGVRVTGVVAVGAGGGEGGGVMLRRC